MHAKSLQSCLTLCNSLDSSPPGSFVHRILQARILEWVAISFSLFPSSTYWRYYLYSIVYSCHRLINHRFVRLFSLFCSILSICLFLCHSHTGFFNIRRRQWHPTPVLLSGKSHGRRCLVGCSPWGGKESDMTERLHFHFSLSCLGEGNGNPLQCSTFWYWSIVD